MWKGPAYCYIIQATWGTRKRTYCLPLPECPPESAVRLILSRISKPLSFITTGSNQCKHTWAELHVRIDLFSQSDLVNFIYQTASSQPQPVNIINQPHLALLTSYSPPHPAPSSSPPHPVKRIQSSSSGQAHPVNFIQSASSRQPHPVCFIQSTSSGPTRSMVRSWSQPKRENEREKVDQ